MAVSPTGGLRPIYIGRARMRVPDRCAAQQLITIDAAWRG